MSAGSRPVQLSLGTLRSIVVTCCQHSPSRLLAFRVSEAISTLVTNVAEPVRGGTEGMAIRSPGACTQDRCSALKWAARRSFLSQRVASRRHSHHDVIC